MLRQWCIDGLLFFDPAHAGKQLGDDDFARLPVEELIRMALKALA